MNRLRDLNVASKLFAGFGVVCLLLALVVAVGIDRLGGSQANLDSVSTDGVASVQTIAEVKEDFSTARFDLLNAAMAPDEAATQAALTAMSASDGVYDQAWQDYLATDPAASKAERAEAEDLMQQYRSAREKLIPLAEANDIAGFYAERNATSTPVVKALNAQLDALSTTEQQAAKDLAAEGSADYHTAITLLLTIGAAALAIATAVAIAVARSIAGPLARTLTVVRGLADGRLDQRVAITTKDEVGQLASALDATMERLSATIRAIAGGATTLATSSEELTTVATQLSSGAEEAATQAQVVSTATEEISANIATV
ncbi:HAMP domain-containing protein, partial [Kineococcus sp. T13]|uniref:MCP four helix bundle domain-containing protein n=1 Tax=Kineococcus vitellinus TaxID=2696565 RepID=UPI0014127EAA|nr:HAMP domain-containing protein [Kineococcus vitellinus]